MQDTLLIELLTEELPPKALKRISEAFANALLEDLRSDGLALSSSTATPLATPRRLAVTITDVLDKAPDQPREVVGPSVKVGLDGTGKPTAALMGFAKKNGVSADELVQIDSPKGKVFACRLLAAGTQLGTNLELKVADALRRLPIPKLMRWGDGDAGQQFVRPVHGLMMLHGTRVVPGTVLGLTSGNATRGHRFLASGAITIPKADDYERVLRDDGRVIASFAARREAIINQIRELQRGAEPIANDALLDEITSLVESPKVYEARFDEAFLAVPPECLILSMQQHQKYVPLRDAASGRLLPRFLFVANIETADPANIIRGNERVLRARLSDAKFFYEQDRKVRLEARVPGLASVVYHNKLGSQLERVQRIQLLAGRIARALGADAMMAERAAWLAKADLVTGMVGEFPELQGIMGRYYALHDGEPQAVADAISEHYLPRFAGDQLPQSPVACAVALADKLDALSGLFGIGQVPTGDKDPFGLRRAALGVVRILIEREIPLGLDLLLDAAVGPGAGRAELESFVFDRLEGYLRERGYSTLEVESVVSLRPQRISLVPLQLDAVRTFAALPEAASLAAANKRARNILRKEGMDGVKPSRADLLVEDAEKALAKAVVDLRGRVDAHYERSEFVDCLKTLAGVKSEVDAFFDQVMVNAEDPNVRENRLALLSELNYLLNRVADISRLAA